MREEIYESIRSLVQIPGQGHHRPDLTRPLHFGVYASTSLPMHRRNSLSWSSPFCTVAAAEESWPPSCGDDEQTALEAAVTSATISP